MKVALVHDWLTGMRGGEKCLEVFCELFPKAHLFTLLHVPGSVSPTIERMDIRTSILQKLPFSARQYRYYLPLLPKIVDGWDTGGESYDLVLSSSHCAAKGVRFRKAARRVCYCFTPMRYLWCQTENYYRGDWKQQALQWARPSLQRWDLRSNDQVDEFIGISNNVCDRIHRFYGRKAVTLYPPVDTEFYSLSKTEIDPKTKTDYLIVGALEPYKRVDLAIEAFREFQHPLQIVGKGTMLDTLRRNAPPNVRFLGWRSDEEIRELYRHARGLVFPGEEDFGIVPLEAQACGCAVIAYGAGGILETARDGETGTFFRKAAPQSLLSALRDFERHSWNPAVLRAQAERFARARFRKEIEQYLARDCGLSPKARSV